MRIIFFCLLVSFVLGSRPNFVVIGRDLQTTVGPELVGRVSLRNSEAIGSLNLVTDAFDGRIVEDKAYKDIVDLENISKSGILKLHIKHSLTENLGPYRS